MAAHQAPRPWDSPGKNTGVGCHFLPQCMKVKSESEVAQLYPTLRPAAYQAPPPMGFSRQEHLSGLPLPSLPQALLVLKSPLSLAYIIAKAGVLISILTAKNAPNLFSTK